MAFSETAGYTYLQVDRPVTSRPLQFMSKVAMYGTRIFGTEAVSGIQEIGIDMPEASAPGTELEEPTSRLVTVRQPVLRPYSAENLRLVLLRRSVPASQESRYNFNHYASRFTAQAPPKLRSSGARNATIRDRVDEIGAERGLDPGNTIVEFDQLLEMSGLGFGTELALAPKTGSLGSSVLRHQVKTCEVELARLSNKAAYPGSSFSAAVPFMRIPEGATDRQFERFTDEVRTFLQPSIYLTLGRMTAHGGSSMAGAGAA